MPTVNRHRHKWFWDFCSYFSWLTYHKLNIELASGSIVAGLARSLVEEKAVEQTVAKETEIESQ